MQETFIGFLTSLANFDEHRSLQTYLFTDRLAQTDRSFAQNRPASAATGCRRAVATKAGCQSGRLQHCPRSRAPRFGDRSGRAGLGAILDDWREQGDFIRIKVLELLFVKGWANRDIATFLQIGEQQVANIRFAAVKKLNERVRGAGLPTDVFPELQSS